MHLKNRFCNFLSPKCAHTPIFYTTDAYDAFLPTFTTFHQVLPPLPLHTDFYITFATFHQFLLPFTDFYTIFSNSFYLLPLLPLPTNFTTFHQFLLSSANFYQLYITFRQLLPTSINFYTSFHQSKMILFFFLCFFFIF